MGISLFIIKSYILLMSKTRYILDEDFESFTKGTEFVRIAQYGTEHIHDEKLQIDDDYETKSVGVTTDQLEQSFSKM